MAMGLRITALITVTRITRTPIIADIMRPHSSIHLRVGMADITTRTAAISRTAATFTMVSMSTMVTAAASTAEAMAMAAIPTVAVRIVAALQGAEVTADL